MKVQNISELVFITISSWVSHLYDGRPLRPLLEPIDAYNVCAVFLFQLFFLLYFYNHVVLGFGHLEISTIV